MFITHLLKIITLVLALTGVTANADHTAPAVVGPDPIDKIEIELHEVAPTIPTDSHKACQGDCPPHC